MSPETREPVARTVYPHEVKNLIDHLNGAADYLRHVPSHPPALFDIKTHYCADPVCEVLDDNESHDLWQQLQRLARDLESAMGKRALEDAEVA